MIVIEYTTHQAPDKPANLGKVRFDERLGQHEIASAVDFYSRARLMGYNPRVILGGEHFPELPLMPSSFTAQAELGGAQ
jgi:hypothetical protein